MKRWKSQQTVLAKPLGVWAGIVDAHRDNGKHFVARADEKFTALMGLEGRVPFQATPYTNISRRPAEDERLCRIDYANQPDLNRAKDFPQYVLRPFPTRNSRIH